jgi:isoleucyl-tRNA synthetase
MLAIFVGDVTLLFGFLVLLLPLLLTELSRPRDPLWGSLVLLLGLGLVTSHDRFNGTLLLVLVSGSFVTSKLVTEVAQSRWQQLSTDEKNRLTSLERWNTGIRQLLEIFSRLGMILSGRIKTLRPSAPAKTTKKKWVRPENNEETQASKQAVTDLHEKSTGPPADLEQQPQETLDRQSPLKDS